MTALLEKLLKKNPNKQVQACLSDLESLLSLTGSDPKEVEEKKEIDLRLTAELDDMMTKLYGPREQEKEQKPNPQATQELNDAVLEQDFIVKMISHLPTIGFEGRKKLVWVIQFVITNSKSGEKDDKSKDKESDKSKDKESFSPAVQYLLKHKEIFPLLTNCYANSDPSVVMNYDSILGTCIQHRALAELIFSDSTLLAPFYKHMESPTSGMDCFSTFKALMTEHKGLPAAEYIKKHYDTFVKNYNGLLQSQNFVTKVQAFQLLNELLCSRVNFEAMVKYINDAENLKLVMTSLKGGKAQQIAVFHVLKIFVSNPRKASEVGDILALNKSKLIDFVNKFEKDRDDPRLDRDKEAMLDRLNELRVKLN